MHNSKLFSVIIGCIFLTYLNCSCTKDISKYNNSKVSTIEYSAEMYSNGSKYLDAKYRFSSDGTLNYNKVTTDIVISDSIITLDVSFFSHLDSLLTKNDSIDSTYYKIGKIDSTNIRRIIVSNNEYVKTITISGYFTSDLPQSIQIVEQTIIDKLNELGIFN